MLVRKFCFFSLLILFIKLDSNILTTKDIRPNLTNSIHNRKTPQKYTNNRKTARSITFTVLYDNTKP